MVTKDPPPCLLLIRHHYHYHYFKYVFSITLSVTHNPNQWPNLNPPSFDAVTNDENLHFLLDFNANISKKPSINISFQKSCS